MVMNFLKANYRKQGIADYDDVISGVDELVEKRDGRQG